MDPLVYAVVHGPSFGADRGFVPHVQLDSFAGGWPQFWSMVVPSVIFWDFCEKRGVRRVGRGRGVDMHAGNS